MTHRLGGWLAAALAALLLLQGCATEIHGDINSSSLKAGGRLITMDGTAVVPTCQFAGASTVTVTCVFRDAFTPGTRTSVVNMTGLSVSDGVSGPPLLVMQLPADANAIGGTYNNNHGGAGALVVNAGHAELPQDGGSNIIAEAGMQLAVVSLPQNAPPDTYFLVFSFRSNTTNQFKVLTAAPVLAAGRTYYASFVPCVNRFSVLPNVPVPQTPLETPIDLSGLAPAYVPCNGQTYAYAVAAAVPVTVVEYYNAGLDHYFITWVPDEIAKLDAGVEIRGWVRTGKSFQTYSVFQPGTSDICRFYIPPGKGDSHFFGRGTTECENTAAAHPDFDEESSTFMHMFLPVAGSCPAGTVTVYRVFSNRPDANHRYMTDRATRDQMVARGWLAEGDGPDLVVMCAPA